TTARAASARVATAPTASRRRQRASPSSSRRSTVVRTYPPAGGLIPLHGRNALQGRNAVEAGVHVQPVAADEAAQRHTTVSGELAGEAPGGADRRGERGPGPRRPRGPPER